MNALKARWLLLIIAVLAIGCANLIEMHTTKDKVAEQKRLNAEKAETMITEEKVLEELAEIANGFPIENSLSWAIVHDILLRSEGEEDIRHEDVVMASGEAMVFAYSPYHFAPMYISLTDSHKRLWDLFGYQTDWIAGPAIGGDLNQVWKFIKEHIDDGHGIHVEGPESFLIYGYKNGRDENNRIVNCIAKWGPGLHGDVYWHEVKRFPAIFSLSSIKKATDPKPNDANLEMLVETILSWQNAHPGLNRELFVHHEVEIEEMKGKKFRLGPNNYGLKGLDAFINDIQNERMVRGMLQPYLNCHAIAFQVGGRQWQAKWFEHQSKLYEGQISHLLSKAGTAYINAAAQLGEFMDLNIAEGNLQNKLVTAVPALKAAYNQEKKAIETLAKLREMMDLP